ncbi:MAG: UpxY family transcription antiterminator [Parabacteroides sp.]|nr:UpxY family transcription antiterminator [Parabacteroides sp.]
MSVCEKKLMLVDEKPLEFRTEEPVWFAMSATFGRELKAKTYLESQSVQCFVPMRYEMVKDKRQGKIRKLVPAISNLLFAYTTKSRIQTLKTGVEFLQYKTILEGGKNTPIIVPEYQMQQFIAVCETLNEHLVYLAPDEVNLEKGTPVRIVGSTFDGVEGTFVRVKNKRKKQVVVQVQGVAAVVIDEYSGGYLEILK